MIRKVVNEILDKIKLMCIAFTSIMLFLCILNLLFTPEEYIYKTIKLTPIFVILADSCIIGFSAFVFAIKRLNLLAKHILYFIINYSAFVALVGMQVIINSNNLFMQIIVISFIFILAYFIVFFINMIIKYLIYKGENKKEEYKEQFKNL